MTGDELDESTKRSPSLFHRNLIRRATNVTDNARLTLVNVREIPEELLTSITTKKGVTKSVTQRFVAHSRVITRAVTHTPPLTTKLTLAVRDLLGREEWWSNELQVLPQQLRFTGTTQETGFA